MSVASALENQPPLPVGYSISVPCTSSFAPTPYTVLPSSTTATPVNLIDPTFVLPVGKWSCSIRMYVGGNGGNAAQYSWVSYIQALWVASASPVNNNQLLYNNEMIIAGSQLFKTFTLSIVSDGITPVGLELNFGASATTLPACYSSQTGNFSYTINSLTGVAISTFYITFTRV